MRDFLRETMRVYPRLPSYAFWRAVELRLLSRVDFAEPVLDVGCGEGEFARMLLGAQKEVVGLDLANNALRQARVLSARVIKADATRLPFSDACFGSALSNCVLEHIPDDVAVVAEMGRVLKPGGVAAITVPSPGLKEHLYPYQKLRAEGRDAEAAEYLEEFDSRLAHLHYRTEAEWREIFTAGGFSEVTLTPYLPAATVAVWSRLETSLMQPVAAVKHWKLLAFALVPPVVRRAALYRLLRKHYLRDPEPGEPHGAWMVVGRKAR